MKSTDHTRLLAELADAYREHAPASYVLNERAQMSLIDGGSHALRLHHPFPPRIVDARGGWVRDEDGHAILDFWQGHLANVLGHNPEVVTAALSRALQDDWGLQTGFTDRLQIETAEVLLRQTGMERVRFTTSGTLATMYAIMLAQSYTGRDRVMKVGGGWHGAHPWGLKGVHRYPGRPRFQQVESEGLPALLADAVVVTRFNDTDLLKDHFRRYGEQLACFILEPFVGVGGFIPADREYIRTARELTRHHGALLIFDEVVTGFRFRPGDAGRLYEVEADLATFGKTIGGGMPVSAVAGRADVLELVGRSRNQRVRFSGGTYSAHPAAMLAAKTVMTHLTEQEAEIYGHLAELGHQVRRCVEDAFAAEGLHARCTGDGNEIIAGGSLFRVHFPHRPDAELASPDQVSDPAICDTVLAEQALPLALLLENVYLLEAHGAVTAAHTDSDADTLHEACGKVARRFRPHLAA